MPLIHRACAEPGQRLPAPTCAFAEGDRGRPGTGEHLAALPSLVIADLDLAADTAWGQAHVRHAAATPEERPAGAYVATTDPKRWRGQHVRLLDVGPA